jgi:hypothetical protein
MVIPPSSFGRAEQSPTTRERKTGQAQHRRDPALLNPFYSLPKVTTKVIKHKEKNYDGCHEEDPML